MADRNDLNTYDLQPQTDAILSLNEYQTNANGFINTKRYDSTMDYLLNTALGLTGEAGEFADIVKKVRFHGHELTPEVREKLIDELGDILWYVAQGCKALMTNLSRVGSGNIRKLTERHGGLRFSEEASKAKEAAKYLDGYGGFDKTRQDRDVKESK